MKKLNVSEARQRLPAIIDEVASTGRAVLVTRRGKPLVKIVPCRPERGTAERLPLRGLPLKLARDFDAPIDGLFEALDR
jgi:prevent-host-death family protein